MRRISVLLALPAFAVMAAPAAAAPASLPTISRTLSAPAAVKRVCAATADKSARGVAISHYTAPLAGYVTARLSGPATSDWDLVAVDRASGRRMATSEAFRSN
jgi:hypothetical protein